ncbi:MAG: NADH dehydrogenase [Elusimicrobia bacterium CG1_02_63_36]|nr:MAG: NADH dehydrogenase [Elusimicrobia bacterium CG1_02_63_36]PIP82404.1 MAG: NADH-quinone oxidoreductase subunit NuoD [Elusimicrobia bacterium CG22_combo_CG10-13_8_21_14_all_63_91]PJA17605.1 MAG: NADH-quinone oxidoreductase subunit NuoD [Elusimicrobia bacterium CG_4_10_14_0_2_um_filter_63_34]PJB26552.1 MAG: NADH-quinone oxidoreductase subunit NuoD [Elusimicrobia bacterium CG_4_9_14_3_um_filter_62_55]
MTETAADNKPKLKSDQMFINLGPQHPSTHGVLRIGLTIEGEIIVNAVPDVGYLHRGTEKLAEIRGYHHCVVLSDRWDYLNAMGNNMVFCMAAEKLMGVEVPERAQQLRVLMLELNRIASHLLFFGTYGIDIGAFTAFLHAFREREMVLDLFEMVCGARMTYNYIRLGGVMKELPKEWLDRCREFVPFFKKRLAEYDDLLSFNPIFLDRTKTVGAVGGKEALAWGWSGPNLRASGVPYDMRKFQPYSSYEKFDFEIPVGKDGSCWDRYYCRVREMHESLKIVEQVLGGLPEGPILGKGVAKVPKAPPGETYAAIEGARGDLGIHLVSDGNMSPYRLHVKAPSFINLQILQEMLVGQKISDVVAILGSIDIVLGEVDR